MRLENTIKQVLTAILIALVVYACGAKSDTLESIIADDINKFDTTYVWKSIESANKIKDLLTLGGENIFNRSAPPLLTSAAVTMKYNGGVPLTTEGANFDSLIDIRDAWIDIAERFRLSLAEIKKLGGEVVLYPGTYSGYTGYKSILLSLLNSNESLKAPGPYEYIVYIENSELIMISDSYIDAYNPDELLISDNFNRIFDREDSGIIFKATDTGENASIVFIDFQFLDNPVALQEISDEELNLSISELKVLYPNKYIFVDNKVEAVYFFQGRSFSDEKSDIWLHRAF